MNRNILFVLTLSLGLAATLQASDEIVLKSGRTLTGHITSETETGYRIKLGPSMYLSVAKDEVVSVSREKPVESNRPTVRLEQVTSSGTIASPTATPAPRHAEKKPSRPSPVKKAVHPPTKAPSSSRAASRHAEGARPHEKKPVTRPHAPAPVEETVSSETLKVGVAIIQKTTVVAAYDIDARDFAAARKAILDPTSGRGFLEGHERRAGRTTWDASWSGVPGPGGKQWKAVVVAATMTVTLPRWRNAAQAAAGEAEQWDAFVKDSSDHQAGHAAIINDGLVSFGQSVSNLNDAGEKELQAETTALFKSTQDRISKRREGYERRRDMRPVIPVGKKPAPAH